MEATEYISINSITHKPSPVASLRTYLFAFFYKTVLERRSEVRRDGRFMNRVRERPEVRTRVEAPYLKVTIHLETWTEHLAMQHQAVYQFSGYIGGCLSYDGRLLNFVPCSKP